LVVALRGLNGERRHEREVLKPLLYHGTY
jgi:hypothetical protein